MIARKTVVLIGLFVSAHLSAAQMPGSPVLQNAWAAPGIVVALDIGGGSGGTAYAGAAAWAPSNARFQVSAGAGIQTATGSSSRAVYGIRLSAPLIQLMSGNLGIGAFIGAGGGAGSATDTLLVKSMIPAGLAIGYRRAVGSAGRGFSLYADPTFERFGATATSQSLFRVGIGLDAGITSRLGVTLGLESGQTAAIGTVGPKGTLYGVGVSMKLGR